jgi:hypothetical protein
MPLFVGFESLEPLFVVKSLGFGNILEHFLDSRHHSLEAAEVHVGTVLKLCENLIGIFFDLVLDVHLSSLLVLLFTGEGIVQTEVGRELCLGGLELVVVEESIDVGNSEEQPGLTLVGSGSWGVLRKETADETTEWCNTSTSGNHDVVRGWVLLRHEHNLSGRASHDNLSSWRAVAQEVGADTLLGWIICFELGAPVGGTTDTEGSSLSGHVITVTGRGDGVKSDRVWLAILLADAWWDDTPRLSLPVWKVPIVIDDDVASLTGGLRSNDALGGDNLSCERSLVLPHIDRDSALVIVWLSFKEILGTDGSAEQRKKEERMSVYC